MKVKELSIKKILELQEKYTLSELKEKIDHSFSGESVEFALAACYLATKEGLGISPFDEQLIAAYEIFENKIVQMNTGEGKTLAAIFAAYLKIRSGHKVHILTFNDYLAKRDYEWMKPITTLLDLKTGVILETTPRDERRELYKRDILYSTAKEVGFDFLRDFIATNQSDIIQPAFDSCIVDEADSVLIDEARIPLVISADIETKITDELIETSKFISNFSDKDYGISIEDETAYLKDSGALKIEKHFGVENIYSEESVNLLAAVNDCLKAQFYLKENKDYIVKDGEIKLIDEYTGRVAIDRHYPGVLQGAVEAKHNLKFSCHGVVMGIIPIQFFIRQYPYLSGMTGTASDSREEFELLYGLSLKIIPPHTPSARKDHGISVYFNREIKFNAIVNDIILHHKKEQPILVGTSSIEESEELAKTLLRHNISNIKVLNAKNDEEEAEIIKMAGHLGTITISTNMAGRGIDIPLGDFDTRQKVVDTGGLYVIATCMHESSRINKQLAGRAGRQGDVGESRVFISLDEEILKKAELKKLVPSKHYPSFTEKELTDSVLLRELNRAQRIVEGEMLEQRKRLLKFTMIGEKHRNSIFSYRKKIMTEEIIPDFWQTENPDLYEFVVNKHGEKNIFSLQQELAVLSINDVWCEYLEYTSDLRRGIHLTKVGGKSPTEEYNILSQQYYESMEEQVSDIMTDYLFKIADLKNLKDLKIHRPLKTRTYLLDESVDELAKQPFLVNAMTEHVLDEEPASVKEKKPGLFDKIFKNRKH